MHKRTEEGWRKVKEYSTKMFANCGFRLHRVNEADMLEFLNSKENRSGYIKELIRKDMEANKD